jgi:nucleoside-diphosphate-sugar epimerase
VKDPLTVFREVNVDGTIQLAKQALEFGVKRFIFVSSIKVNGEKTDKHPFTAKSKPNPQDSYAISKLEAEIALREISVQSSMEMVIIRPPLVYGQGVKGNFERLTRLVESGVPLPLASIKNKRSLISLENLLQLLSKAVIDPAMANQTLLVSDGQDLSTPQLIKKIANSVSKPARLFPLPVKLLKILGKLTGKSEVINRLTENLQIDGTSHLGSDPKS